MKRSRINPISKKRRNRSGQPGNLGIVRLYGEALTELRWEAFRRSDGRCEMQRFGQRCNYPITFENSEMAHVRNRRMYGDVIDNVLMSCRIRKDGDTGCHHLSHNPKACPPKPR